MMFKAMSSVFLVTALITPSIGHATAEPAAEVHKGAADAAIIKQSPPAPATRRKGLIKVIVFDLEGSDLPAEHAAMVGWSLLTEIRKLDGVSAMGMDEVRAMLSGEENRIMQGCEAEESCLSTVAGALGAQFLIMGSIGRVGESSVMSLKRLNMESGAVAGSVNKRLRGGSGEEFLEAVGPIIEELFEGFAIRPGLSRGVSAQLVGRWDPPPLKPWMTIATLSTAGAAAFLTGVFGIRRQIFQAEDLDLRNRSVTEAVSGAELTEAEDAFVANHWRTIGFGTAALVVGAAGGVMYLFTDWQGDGNQSTGLTVTPGPSGLILSGRF